MDALEPQSGRSSKVLARLQLLVVCFWWNPVSVAPGGDWRCLQGDDAAGRLLAEPAQERDVARGGCCASGHFAAVARMP